VRVADKPDDTGERVGLSVGPDARYGWRVWLICPLCRVRRMHLYRTAWGLRCRVCAKVR
jgi:hypothetical protein